ncbi:septum site-determining protein MinC [Bordetella genomosp. 11]|uniref:Probable septum site-determining protein MinC n=1 Tax=Bordetella genomosp. 11 TaxID=1416808 RepID=A0A261UZ76_9BORD|nr:septum site-determining protein MinC [Bordetella genomosp. 11]OZI67179.1 septum site-determining protein MinC [Bordetella genomosp. 11]
MSSDPLALDFKSATLYAVRVVLHSADIGRLAAALDKRMADAGSFFENEPVVIDASRVEGLVDWPALLDALRGHNLPPIGVVAEGDNLQAAKDAGLAPVELSTPPARVAPTDAGNTPPPLPTQPAAALTAAPAPQGDSGATAPPDDAGGAHQGVTGDASQPGTAESGTAGAKAEANGTQPATGSPGASTVSHGKPGRKGDVAPAGQDGQATAQAKPGPQAAAGTRTREPLPTRAARETTSSPSPTPADPQSSSALVISRPLRSGQRVYARHTDLVVIGMVSPGAEVIADGNVHVYGPLRGKAMAGARGDTSARIFTTHLDAELLAVAGVYRVVEDKLDANLHGQPALVRLDGDTLRIEALKA